jgi:hypothetical protein
VSQDVINCPDCARRTPAARATCLYCGARLPVTKIEAAPSQRAIDNAERAFNTVLEPAGRPATEATEAALASALRIEPDEARAFIEVGKPVPLARSQSRHEAELIAALVRTCGLKAGVVADEDLKLDSQLVRARRVVCREREIEIHHSGGVLLLPPPEIRLLVTGSLKNTRVDYTEGIAGMRAQSGVVLDTSQFRSDELLLDVYATVLEKSFRIKADAFDYSGLVRPLSFRAEMNFRAARAALRELAPHAAVDDDFARVRRLLARAWPERSRVESRGVKRAGLAHRPVAQSSLISGNRDQFDRYSRLIFLSTVK